MLLLPAAGAEPRGHIAVLDMGTGLPAGGRTAHPPAALAEVLRQGGFQADLLTPEQMRDPAVLTPARYDAVVLSQSPFFPLDARAAFLAFLRGGGSFLATDGYAFDRPVRRLGDAWVDADPGPFTLNTRKGQPGDAVTFLPDQIGVFDPQFPLERAVQFKGAGVWSAVVPAIHLARPAAGFSASVLTGINDPVFPAVHRRWTPVVEAFDPSGRLCGTALSLARCFAGPFRGSCWAVSGLASGDDLFLKSASRRRLLWAVMDDLVRRTFVHGLATDRASYRRGEQARITAAVTCMGRRRFQGTAVLRVEGRVVKRVVLNLAPGESRTIEASLSANASGRDLVRVAVELRAGGRALDRMEGAWCVWDEQTVARGPRVGWRDNLLTLDGRPRLLLGTNQTGMMFYSLDEGPATWDRDFRLMRRHGIRILRILHFSPFAAGGYAGRPQHSPLDLRTRPERLRRQMDAIVQLAQKHGVVVFLSLHDWMGVALTDEELAAQRDWNRFWAARYRRVPGILYDVQNEPAVEDSHAPHVVALWNQWLQGRYGSDAALQAAWVRNPPEASLPRVPLGRRSEDWHDARSADRRLFEAELLNRWVRANVAGIRDGDPDALVTVGYLPTMAPADKILGARHTDFSNMHYYGPVAELPLELKLIDRRAYGRGFSLGEFGAQEAHDARVRGETRVPVEASIQRFRTTLHYAFGMGAAFAANWCWKETDAMVFPWGLIQRGSAVPRPWLESMARTARFLERIEPVGWEPRVFLLVPDRHRLGPHFMEIHRALQRSVDLLLDQSVDFAVLNEEDLARIPSRARILFWPLPYCPEDAVFARVVEWVRGGGTLYLSGGIGFDAARRPLRYDRWGQLGLPGAPARGPFQADELCWSFPLVESRLARGRVLFAPYPLELRPRDGDAAVYARALSLAGEQGHAWTSDRGRVRVQSVPLRGGGRLVLAARTDSASTAGRVRMEGVLGEVRLGPAQTALLQVDRHGVVVAADPPEAIGRDPRSPARGGPVAGRPSRGGFRTAASK